jgi:hypothetical protein
MQNSRSILLPFAGMLILLLFVFMSYVNDAIFLDRIIVCAFILSIVFIGKIRESLQKSVSGSENRTNNPIT